MSSLYCSWTWTNDPSTPSLFPEYNSLIKPITDEQFNSFHFIDRELYSRLIFNHGRDVIESLQVMAFWLWLERERYCPMKLVYKILRELPPHLLSQVADETVLCLKIIESDHFIYSVTDEEILLLQSLMEKKRISLVELYENRMSIVSKVTALANEICWRAFKDILQKVFDGPGPVIVNPNPNPNQASSSRNTNLMPPVRGIPVYPGQLVGFMGVPTRYLTNPDTGGDGVGGGHELMTNAIGGIPNNQMVVPPPNQMVVVPPPNQMVVVAPQAQNSNFNPYAHLQHHQQEEEEMEFLNIRFNPINPYDLQHLHHLQEMEAVNRELGERMSNVHISEHDPDQVEEIDEVQVPAEDRTIFLTFSKGYPISENEVREFFTRKYGGFIEDIFMQEVPPGEQSLFARVVCRSMSVIDSVAPRGSKAKFSINGKHVWARKYVKKANTTTRSPQQASGAGPSQSSG